ncbi:MAG: hypothetical protein H3C34_19005 [Caldilineaceae bacterium]|nr:hypothetical protein [Caldilineaceae bacterium]
MRKYQSIISVLLVTLFALLPGVAAAQDEAAVPTAEATAQPLTIFTTYPAQIIGRGESLNLPLKLRSGSAEAVKLAVEDVPEGWTVSFRGGSRTVTAVYVDGQNDSAVDLRVEAPANAEAGPHAFTVVATGADETSRLPLTLTVEEKAPPQLTLDTDLPTLRGKPSSSFRYNVTVKNEGGDDMNVSLSAETPPAFLATFTLNGQDVTSIPLTGGESKRLSVEVRAFNEVPAGTYPVTVNAQSGDLSASLPLEAEVVGQAELTFSTPDGRLSGEANAGRSTSFKLVVGNTGTAPAREVKVSANAPSGWNVTLEPESIPEVAPGQTVEVTANVQPADKAINGDYVVSYSARSDQASTKNMEMRITVTTSTLWGVAGVALIAVAVAAVALAVGRFGRR